MVGACTDMMIMLLGGNTNAPEFQTMGVIFGDVVLVHRNLLFVIMSNVLLAIDIWMANYSIVTLPFKP